MFLLFASLCLILILFCFLPCALILFAWAWRGRRTDDHPCCRSCGFDLIGSQGTPSACPECGQRLSARHIRIGNRERRRGPLTLLAVGLVATTVLTAASAWRVANQASLMAMLPEPALRILDQYDPGAREELVRRMTADQLSPTTIAAVIATALDVQGDLDQRWDPNWGRFIEQAHAHGHLSRADSERYLKQAVAFRITVRPRVQIGRTPVLASRLHRTRAGDLDVKAEARWEDLAVAGQTIDVLPDPQSVTNLRAHPRGYSASNHLVALPPLGQSLGTFRVTGQVRIDLTQNALPNPMSAQGWVTKPDPLDVDVVEQLTGNYLGEVADNQRLAAHSFVGIGTLPGAHANSTPMLMITQLNRPQNPKFPEWLIDVGHGPEPLHGLNFSSQRVTETPSGQELEVHTDVWYLDRITQRPGGLPPHFSLILKIDTDRAETYPDSNRRPWWWGEIRFDNVPRDTPRVDLSFFDRIQSPSDLPPGVVPARAITLPLP